MEVSVIIPTLMKREDQLQRLFSSLEKQTYSDFRVVLITPDLPNTKRERLYEILEKFELDISLVTQSGKGFINAVNTALDNSSDITISTDDDATLNEKSVENYVRLFENDKIGIVTGIVNGVPPFFNRTLYLYLINFFCNSKPLSPNLKGYLTYFNQAGILSMNPLNSLSTTPLMLSPIGVNMAWRREAIGKFRIPEILKLGILNESYLALSAVLNGFDVILSYKINVHHSKNEDSLSRGMKNNMDLEKVYEFYLSPAIVNKIYPINIEVLRSFKKHIIKFLPLRYSKVATSSLEQAELML